MHQAAFLNAGPMGTTGWRHPDADPSFLTAKYYRHVARQLRIQRRRWLIKEHNLRFYCQFTDSFLVKSLNLY